MLKKILLQNVDDIQKTDEIKESSTSTLFTLLWELMSKA